jgi:hypothetical protein
MVACGDEFGRALAKHFGLPGNQLLDNVQVHARRDSIFGVTLTLALTPQDLEAIGRLMGAKQTAPLSIPTDPQPIEQTGRLY